VSFRRSQTSFNYRPVASVTKSEVFRHFDSVADYAALRESPCNVGKASSYDGVDWLGVETQAEAAHICQRGVWPEGLARMERELAGFESPAATSIRRAQIWADQGDALDIHRVNSGQLDQAWRRTRRLARRASQNLVIAFPLMIRSRDTADKLFWCGAAALKLTDVLTIAGYTVTLVGTHGTTYDGHTSHDSLIVKAAAAPLDVEALIVAVAFPGFTRTVGFRAIASNVFPVSSGLGIALYDDQKPLEALNLPTGNVLGGLFAAVDSRETARAWIAAQLAKLEASQITS
jgi:hypothetical protein